jgi:TolB protein
MSATNGKRKALLRRRALFALLLAVFIPGCDSTTGPIAEGLPIVFFEGSLSGQLVLMSADGKVRQQLLDMPAAFAQYPRWSPNGEQIVFYQLPSDPYGSGGGRFIINADGSGLRRIASIGPGAADWSPDGTRLVANSENRLVVFGPDGGDLEFLPPTNVSTGDLNRGISWSPDGNEILYNGMHEFDGWSTGPDIWIFNLVTGVSRMLVTPGVDARWSPDGRQVAYVSTNGYGGPGRLAVINSDGSNQRILTDNSQTLPKVTWSPDGTTLLFVGAGDDAHSDLHAIPVAGGQVRNITNTPGNYARHPDWYRER